MIRRGSIVYDKADRRHLGLVENVLWRNLRTGDGLARVRWLDTDWLSNVETKNLRPAREPRFSGTEITNLKRRLRDD